MITDAIAHASRYAALHPDELTPRQALELLYQLQKQAATAQEAT